MTVSTKVLRVPDPARGLWLLPLADTLSIALWMLAFGGNTVTWRGLRYRIAKGGRLVPLDPS